MDGRTHSTHDELEHWAVTRAHHIVVHQGMSLIRAAQCLDHKRTNAKTYALRQAIADCLVEALQHQPPAIAATSEPAITES
ncbi:hypothetical protein M0654_07110 [Rhizobium sp. NTR19]|uniref:Uncharacterized protein n=1 Tax=Neorhizobium turbinariae TaxID=2937795 RepID=A0ABT0IPK4_9HYPH|nr:hypothetical protein [Neorhizobium turbinariae]MCK8779754.1 hypothetical protein [Neorhizobium turbinariae]